ILVLMSHFAYIVVRALRWSIAIRNANQFTRFVDLYWITAIVVSLSTLTPVQLGEALKIELLKRQGVLDRLPGLGAFVFERFLDFLTLGLMGVVGLVYGSGLAKRHPNVGTSAAVLIVLVLIGLYTLLRFDPGGRASHWLDSIRLCI